MGTDNLIFLENIEWFDDTGKQLVQRIPESGSGEIKWGAQLTVRESQAAVFFYKGKAVKAFAQGRHTLKSANIPILTKILSVPWAMESPLRSEIIFCNLKVFTNLKWGTRDPVTFKDSELGLVRLRAFGVFNLQIVQPILFVNSLVGTQGMFSASEIEEYLNRVIVSRFNDYMGDMLDSVLNLPSKYDEISQGLAKKLQKDFQHFGLALTHLYINSVTPPPEVQQAIDDRSRMEVLNDMDKLMQMKAAMAMEKAAESDGGAGNGMGMGMGMMMPAMFAKFFTGEKTNGAASASESPITCQECGHAIPEEAHFCPMCGHQQVLFKDCLKCGKHITVNAKFCSRCGHPVDELPTPRICGHCKAENLSDSRFCHQCGERM